MLVRGLEMNAGWLNAPANRKEGEVTKEVVSEFERIMQGQNAAKNGYAVGENVDLKRLNSGVDMLLSSLNGGVKCLF